MAMIWRLIRSVILHVRLWRAEKDTLYLKNFQADWIDGRQKR